MITDRSINTIRQKCNKERGLKILKYKYLSTEILRYTSNHWGQGNCN